jgi:hypothetical protein
MRRRSLLVVIGLLPCLWLAAPASANPGCDAPPGTAAADQYCETLPTADGMTDATGEHLLPLASVLPKDVVRALKRAGLLGQVLLALPAVAPRSSKSAGGAAARNAAADPRLGSLLPGQPDTPRSVLSTTLHASGQVGKGFAWTLLLSLLALASVSVLGSLRGLSVR